MLQTLCFALHVDPNSAIYSKSKDRLKQLVLARCGPFTDRLANFENSITEGKLSDQAFGYFKLDKRPCDDSGENVIYAVSRCGAEVKLPAHLHNGTWDVEHAFSFPRACIKSGLLTVTFVQLFSDQKIELMVPELLPVVPEPPVPARPGGACGSVDVLSPRSSASSAVPLPPNGAGGALG